MEHLLRTERSSALACIVRYEYRGNGEFGTSEKYADAHALNATLTGSWYRHGARGGAQLLPGMVVLEAARESSSCSHVNDHTNLSAMLLPQALDEDTPMPEPGVLTIPQVIPLLNRAINAASDDDFDS